MPMRELWWNPLSWIEWLQSALAEVAKSSPKAAFRSLKLRLEPLEDRMVPSTVQSLTYGPFPTAVDQAGVSAPVASQPPQLFQPNGGQTPVGAGYTAQLPGLQVALNAGGMTFDPGHAADPVSFEYIGANGEASAKGFDPAGAGSAVEYGEVSYQDEWAGINAVYSISDGQFSYDLVVEPGAAPAQIQIKVNGATGLSIDSSGNLVIEAEDGTVFTEYGTLHLPENQRHRGTSSGAVRPLGQ
jgi:hypothetical protein